MLRFVAFDIAIFLLPFAIYAFWLIVTRSGVGSAANWQARTLAYLALGGAVLMIVTLVIFTTFQGSPPGGTYHPARLEGGKIIPGHID
jgi:hypothetical protein